MASSIASLAKAASVGLVAPRCPTVLDFARGKTGGGGGGAIMGSGGGGGRGTTVPVKEGGGGGGIAPLSSSSSLASTDLVCRTQRRETMVTRHIHKDRSCHI